MPALSKKQVPSVSRKQQKLFAIAEHDPSKVSKKNRGVLKVSKKVKREFASTKIKGLPRKVKKSDKV